MKIAVVIPCYKVDTHIEEVIFNLPETVTYIITVNDCSPDSTETILLNMQKGNSKIIYLKNEKNLGVGGAMIMGYRKSLELECDITVKMDGDGQMDASYLPALIKPILEDKADFVKGNRFRDYRSLGKMPLIRRFGNIGLSFLIKAASGYWNIFDPTNGYFAVKNEILLNMDLERIHKRYFFETSQLIELYYMNAVVQDLNMTANYGNEVSNLSITRTIFEFPPKLLRAFLKRILLKYFLYDFNIASVYFLVGTPLFLVGSLYGGINYAHYSSNHLAAPTGTVVIPTLLIILGFQLLLSAITYDIGNYPKK
jgi:glycosyltransferase involved in cell wall biosynthesis